jgi:hypothetical protein
MKTREIPANRVNYLRMLEAVSRPDMGERETRRWIRLVALISAGMLKSSDLILSALVSGWVLRTALSQGA